MSKICQYCGTALNDVTKFCKVCGRSAERVAAVLCQNCGAQIADNAKFCDSCGTQTVAEQTAIQEQQVRNSDAHMDKSVSGSVWITVAMVLFALFFTILFGFEDGEARVVTITAIAFAVFMTGLKWYFEIKAQKRYKREAEEKTRR